MVKQLKRLHQHHTSKTKVQFEESNYLSITCDFWRSRTQNSFLVITGHYVDKNLEQHSTILKFMSFEERHFSPIIAAEIEKQLINLDLFDKLVTITCDGAANMKDMFNYFSRRNIKFIWCIAHRLHLVICNSLNLWVTLKKKKNNKSNEKVLEEDVDEENNDQQIVVTEMVRTMSVDIEQLLYNDGGDEAEEQTSDNDNDDDEGQSDKSNVRFCRLFILVTYFYC